MRALLKHIRKIEGGHRSRKGERRLSTPLKLRVSICMILACPLYFGERRAQEMIEESAVTAHTHNHGAYASAYRRRAEARERARSHRRHVLRERACRMALRLHERFGPDVRVVLFGSVLERDRFHSRSDIDLAVEGLTADEYWDACALLEPLAGDEMLDLVRLETAGRPLRGQVERAGEVLP